MLDIPVRCSESNVRMLRPKLRRKRTKKRKSTDLQPVKTIPKRIISLCITLFFTSAVMAQTGVSGSGSVKPIQLADAIELALKQASSFKSAEFTERIAAEDVRQAKAAFYPKVAAVPTLIYTTPSLVRPSFGLPRPPSFLGANAISEYQALANTSGELDTSGKLRATLRRNEFLLTITRPGTEHARP